MAADIGPTDVLPDLVRSLVALKAELAGLDPELLPATEPGAPATAQDLAAAEAHVGRALDPHHRRLLQAVNGWDDFFLGVRLLAAEQLGRGELWDQGQMFLDVYFGDGPIPADFPARHELLPVAVGIEVSGVHACWVDGPTTDGGHPILWLQGEEIERFPNAEWYARGAGRELQHHIDQQRVRSQQQQRD